MENNASQTAGSFKDKWEKNTQLVFAETLNEESDIFQWILTRNGFAFPHELSDHLKPRKRILDAGCGNGRVTALLHRYVSNEAEVVGIDLVAAHVAKENLKGYDRIQTFTKDLLEDLSDLGTFDFIYCQEVLHHTADPKAAFLNLCQNLSAGGEIAIYVYKQKAPLREYADDFIRNLISELPYDGAMDSMKQLTEFARVVSTQHIKINVPDLDILGIEAGEYDVQRLLYHFCFKNFWNPALSFEENAAINYDWYHPQLCTRHTLDEVQSWFTEAHLKVIHSCVDHYGITVRGIKP